MYIVHQSNAYDLYIIYSVPMYAFRQFLLYAHFVFILRIFYTLFTVEKTFFSVIIMIRIIKKENQIHFTLIYLFVKIHNICCIEVLFDE